MAVDEFSELVDGNIPRVDLVGKAANGTSFLIMKSEDSDDEHARNRGIVEARLVKQLLEATADVEKADDPSDDLDAGGDVLVGTDDNTPGSAEWETVDSDSAAKWVAILARCYNAVKALKKREKAEGDDDAVCQLDDACCAIDYAISCLAPYSVQEAADAAAPVFDGAALAKSVEAAVEPLSVLESYIPLLKAGRVLSGANEGLLRSAADALTKVLSSLPAPIPEGGVMKSEEVTVEKSVEEQLAEAQARLAKAEKKIAKQAKKIAKAQVGKPVPGTHQADIDAGAYAAPLADETGDHGPNPVDGPNKLGYQVSPAENTVATPSDVKTLSGVAGSQDDITGKDVMVGNAVVDTGVVSSDTPQGAPKDKAAGVAKAKGGKKGKKAKGDAVVSDDAAVTKAGPQQAVYDSAGKLLGTVDPGKITELIAEGGKDAAAAATPAPDGGSADDAAKTSDAQAQAATSPAAPADMAPVDSGVVGTPANDQGVAKSQDEIVQEALAKINAAHNALVAKNAVLEERIEYLGAPAPSRVLSNGVMPPKEMLRGMDAGGSVTDITKAGEALRERFEKSQDVAERAEIEKEMKAHAAQVWADIVNRPTPAFE